MIHRSLMNSSHVRHDVRHRRRMTTRPRLNAVRDSIFAWVREQSNSLRQLIQQGDVAHEDSEDDEDDEGGDQGPD